MLSRELVGKVMTQAVLSIDVQEPVSEAVRYFRTYPIHHLPVVRGAKALGMLSSADLMKLEHFLPRNESVNKGFLDAKISIASLLRGPPITVLPRQTVGEAAAKMASEGIHGLLVVDDQENLIGILTTTDVMNAALNFERNETAAAPPSPAIAEELTLSETQLLQATAAARAAYASGSDPDNVAASLLFVLQRHHLLEDVLRVADRYISAGQDEQLHSKLLQCIARAKHHAATAGHVQESSLGLSVD